MHLTELCTHSFAATLFSLFVLSERTNANDASSYLNKNRPFLLLFKPYSVKTPCSSSEISNQIWCAKIMSAKEQPPPLVPKLKTLNKGLKLAEQWVKNMPGEAGEEPGHLEIEGRPAGLGLGARVLPKSHLAPSNDPLERKIMRHLGVGKKKPIADMESKLPANNGFDSDDDDDESLESRTNAFVKKRAGPQLSMPPSKKKSNR